MPTHSHEIEPATKKEEKDMMHAVQGDIAVTAARDLDTHAVDYYNDEVEPTDEEYATLRK